MKANRVCVIALCGFSLLLSGGCRKKPKDISNMDAKELMEMRKESGELEMREGVILLNNNRLDQAEVKLQGALSKNPNLHMALNALGIVYTYKRDYPKAVETFKRLLQLNPQFHDAYNSLGAIYMELGDYDQAKENLLTAANSKEYPMPESAYANLAILEMRQEKIDSALRYIDKGILLNNRYATLYSLKGACLERQGKAEEALENYEKGLKLTKNPTPQQLFAMGRLYSQTGNKIRALDCLEQALGKCQDLQLKEEISKLIREVEK